MLFSITAFTVLFCSCQFMGMPLSQTVCFLRLRTLYFIFITPSLSTVMIIIFGSERRSADCWTHCTIRPMRTVTLLNSVFYLEQLVYFLAKTMWNRKNCNFVFCEKNVTDITLFQPSIRWLHAIADRGIYYHPILQMRRQKSRVMN